MTQPQPANPDTGTNVVAAAALALALIKLEQQARQDVTTTITTLYKGLGAAALLAAAAAPATTLTGLALISQPMFHKTTTSLLSAARLKTADTIRSSYQAATQVAQSKLAADGLELPDDLPDLGTSMDTLLNDLDTMFGHAQTSLQNLVQASYNPADPNTMMTDILDSSTTLNQRATAAATTAVHRGSTDATQALLSDYQMHTGTAVLKRWKVTSNNPCGMCRALDGTTAGINAEFNARATTDQKDLRPAWRNLSGPPRHPNCRCQLELVAA